MTDLDLVLKAIEAGDYDEDLTAIYMACMNRANDSGSSFRWRITIGGQTWDEDSLTMGEMRVVERITSMTWAEVPRPLASAEATGAFMIAHFNKIDGLSFADAIEKADGYTVAEIVKAVTEYQVPEPEGKGPAA